MPFIVGAPRSGTTLLRLILDAHSDLAIPPETGFLALAESWQTAPPPDARRLVDAMSRFPADAPTWPDFGLAADDLTSAIDRQGPFDLPTAVRTFYAQYAARFGKRRVGDKTPMYCFHLAPIQALLPEARVIHLVRDGRDVAASWRRTWFAPGAGMTSLAQGWTGHVAAVRRAAERVGVPLVEIRYELLVREPESTLRTLCDFVELPFDARMLAHHDRAMDRLAEHGPRLSAGGAVLVSRSKRFDQQQRSATPISAARIGVWRSDLSPDEVAEFEAVAGPWLDELGYARAAS